MKVADYVLKLLLFCFAGRVGLLETFCEPPCQGLCQGQFPHRAGAAMNFVGTSLMSLEVPATLSLPEGSCFGKKKYPSWLRENR